MLLKKTLNPGEVNEVNGVGQFIKIMNCENTLRLRATQKGHEVITTDAKAGFELATSQAFDQLILESETQQKIEIWVSKHKLNYDALSTKPSRSESFIVDHFGQTQSVLPFDPAQAGAKIISEGLGFWIGGEGVNKESGIYVAGGSIYEHSSAAPLYAFVDAAPDKVVAGVVGSVQVTPDYGARNAVISVDFAVHDVFYSSSIKQVITNINTGASTGFLIEKINNAIGTGVGFIGLRSNDKRDLITLNFDGSYSFTTNPNSGSFTERCLVKSVDNGFFVLGEGYAGAPNKVHKYKAGIWSLEPVPAAFVNNNITNAFLDDFSPTIWLKANDGIYKSDDNLVTVEKVNELDGIEFTSMSFSDSAVMFKTNTTCYVMTRETRDVVDLHSKFTDFAGANLIGEQWIVISERFLYASSNKFVTSNVVYEHDFNFSKHSLDKLVMCEQIGDFLNVWAHSTDKSEILKFDLVDDLTNPKAKFRVFKESF